MKSQRIIDLWIQQRDSPEPEVVSVAGHGREPCCCAITAMIRSGCKYIWLVPRPFQLKAPLEQAILSNLQYALIE